VVQNRRRQRSVRGRLERGVVLAFYRGRGSIGEGWPGGFNVGVNVFNAIEDVGGFKRGIKGGKMKARW
jgi:hypothetical protein